MYYITTKKASGVIAGSQTSENGSIEWTKELPDYCQLSFGIKKHVTPILAGLLEVDSQRIWSFDRFFTEVTSALSRKLIHVFHVNKAQSIRIYLHSEGTYEELQSLVMEQTDVSNSNQILLFQDSSLLSVIEELTPGRGYPDSSEDDPVMLFSKENNNITLVPPADMPKFPTFPNLVSVENDATLAKTACSVGHVAKRRVERLSRCSRLVHKCVDQFTTAVGKDLEQVLAKSERLRDVTRCVEDLVAAVDQGETTIRALLRGSEGAGPRVLWASDLGELTREQAGVLSPAVKQLHQRYVTERTLRREWSAATRGFPCPGAARAPARARTLVDRLRDSWQHLLRDRATRSLTYNDEQFHVLERIKVGETGRRLRSLLETECRPAVAQLAESLADWYKMAQTVFVQARILDKDVDAYERRLDAFTCRLSERNVDFHASLLGKLAAPDRTSAGLARNSDNGRVRKSLKSIKVVQEEMSHILQENSTLVNQFHTLTMTMAVNSNGKDINK